jgi:hypothetical protein
VTVGVPSLHTCAIVDSSTAYCWGYDNYDQTGDKYHIGDPVEADKNDYTPQQVCEYVQANGSCSITLTSVLDITGGYAHTCALIDLANETPHGVKCWGQNDDGEIGDGTTDADDAYEEHYRQRPTWVID